MVKVATTGSMSIGYVEWLRRQGIPVFQGKDIYWQLYKGALIPASIGPCFVNLSSDEVKSLLRDSGAWFLRYSSDPCAQQTEWWYVLCDRFDPNKLSSNMRNQIKRGNRNCLVKKITGEWLAEHGYECYSAAFVRYKNATPAIESVFRGEVLAAERGPTEYWGVFVDDELAGYCKCIADDDYVGTSVIKLDPAYLRQYSSYALISYLIDHYVVKQGRSISNGSRSVAHETAFQDFLLKIGFRKQYCRLNVVYQPWLESAVRVCYPFRRLVAKLPDRGSLHKLQSLLFQEELNKICNRSITKGSSAP
jgi:hypothetical protein